MDLVNKSPVDITNYILTKYVKNRREKTHRLLIGKAEKVAKIYIFKHNIWRFHDEDISFSRKLEVMFDDPILMRRLF